MSRQAAPDPLTEPSNRWYVYTLQSEENPRRFCTGMTDNLDARVRRHNQGRSPHTGKWSPWDLAAYVAVRRWDKVAELERYFKAGSGHAWAHKHLWR